MSPLDPVAAIQASPSMTASGTEKSDSPIRRSHSMAVELTSPHPRIELRSHSLPLASPGAVEKNGKFALTPCRAPPRRELQPVETFVETAIAQQHHEQGYRAILDCVRKRQDANLLYRLLIVLRTNGNTLHELMTFPKKHAQLLHTIFKLDPFIIPPRLQNDQAYQNLVESYQLADAHLNFVVAIVSANSVLLTPALGALWKMIGSYATTQESIDLERLKRLHAAVATLLRLVPKGTVELFPLVASNFPFRLLSTEHIVGYARQCFTVLEYAPTLEPQILELLVDKALEMDVEIRIKEGGDVEIDKEELVKEEDGDGIFDLELDNGHEANQKYTEETPESKQDTEKKIDEMADKLDLMMLLLFQHIEERISKDPESASAIFQMILPVFENAILTTYRSKYVQFILLYVCGFSDTEELYREFAGKLIEQVVDPYRATATRQSAACYLASFVSRASYVCSETACEAVAALLRWAETYVQVVQRNGTESSDLRSPCELHSLFFTICQAAFYIMCFRGAETVSYHREALEYFSTPKEDLDPIEECPYPGLDHIDIGTSRWEHLCGHRLQPLRYCLESVREEFINVAEVFELVQPELLARLETEAQKQSTGSKPARPRGKPINTPATLAIQRRKGGVGGLGRGSNPLDSFFPFDPYLLRRSHEYIDPLYQHWEGSIEKQDVDDDREDEIAPQEEMGSNMDASETEEEVDDDDEEDDSSSVEPEQEHMTASVGSSSFLQNMSYNSETTSLSSSIQHGVSPSPAEYRQAQQEAWSNALKRPRAPSIAENGSW